MSFISQIDWWMYVLMVVGIFGIVLAANYVLKKINETRLDNRLVRLQDKASVSRISQAVHRQPMEMPTRIRLESIVEQSNPPTLMPTFPTETPKDQIQIMNFPDSKLTDAPNTPAINEINVHTSTVEQTNLGTSYKESSKIQKASNSTDIIHIDEIVDNVMNINDSKSTQSAIILLKDVQNDEDLKISATNLQKKHTDSRTKISVDKIAPTASTSQCKQDKT